MSGVGEKDGDKLGNIVGDADGAAVGDADGAKLGVAGLKLGDCDGETDGL